MNLAAFRNDNNFCLFEDDAICLLSKVFSGKRSAKEKKAVLSEEFQIDVTEKIDQEVSLMCNLSDGLIEKGRKEGLIEGREQTLFSLVKDGVLTLSNAAQRAGMEPSEFEQKYKAFCQ